MVCSTDPQRLYFEPLTTPVGASTALQSSYLEPLLLLNFDLDADPGPTFDLDADPDLDLAFPKAPDPLSKDDEDPCGSGSATLDTDLF